MCCIFDDIDSIYDPLIRKCLLDLQADILLTARSHSKEYQHIHIISISHTLTAQQHHTRLLLLESNWLVFNLKAHSATHIKNVLTKLGYQDDIINEILEQRRKCNKYCITFISNQYPYVIFNNQKIMIK